MLELLFSVIFLVVAILYIRNLLKTLKAIHYTNRIREPYDALYLIIPIVNFYFYFVLVKAITGSIENEYKSRGLPVPHRPTYTAGILSAILLIVVSVLNICVTVFEITNPILAIVLALATITRIVSLITHWIQTHSYKKKILAMPPFEEATEQTEAEPAI